MSWDQAPVCFGADPVVHYEKNQALNILHPHPADCSPRHFYQIFEDLRDLIIRGPWKSDFRPSEVREALGEIYKEFNATIDPSLGNHDFWDRS